MKKNTRLPQILTLICLCLCFDSFGQAVMQKVSLADQTYRGPHTSSTAYAPVAPSSSTSVMAKNGMTAEPKNYRSFTAPYKNTSDAAREANRGYENHPEAGLLFPGTPCNNCYELINKRTELTKTFEKPTADGGKDVMVQTSNMPMHYRDEAGNWRTVKTHLAPLTTAGVYAATEQPVPVVINAHDKFSSLGKEGESFQFNNNLELIYVKADGTEVSLGAADWTHHTAGDEGAYVTNAWPGVDIEMTVMRGSIKTNFYINHSMPDYAAGKLLVRDHFQMDRGLSLNTDGRSHLIDFLTIRNSAGDVKYSVSAATVFEKKDYQNTMNMLEYSIGENNTVDIVLPGTYLNKPAASYPMIIDPLVSTAGTSTVVNGSTYNAGWTAGIGCSYMNLATTPPNVTVTDIQFSFEYTSLTAGLEYGAFSFYKGACRSPGSAAGGLSWSCLTPLSGTCTSTGGPTYSIFADMAPCVPAPQCAAYNLNIQMLFYQNWLPTGACSITYFYGSQPLIITVFGHTVELTAAGVTGTPAVICAGQTATLAATGTYGVPPYTYSWTPGPVAGSPATVTPGVTTTYNLTVTDACGITTTGTTTITVNPTTPITGTLSVCIGNTTNLADATPGGTWSSGTTGVATVGAGTGVVTGMGTGTSSITYTTPGGCQAFAVVTVTPLPVAITGTLFVCQGSTTTLHDVTLGGAWSSSNVGVATVTAGGGVVTGVSAGTATITYGTPGCVATAVVTVNPTPDITGTALFNPTTCNGTDGTITLSGLAPGETYIVHYTAPSGPVTTTIVADATGNVVIINLGGGNYTTISVTNSFGCVSNVVGPILLVASGNPPAPVLTNSSPVCDGGAVNFTATDAATGVTYNWSGPGGYLSNNQNPVINPATLTANGTYTCTVTLAGCTSLPATTVVVVNPVPVISIINSAGPSACLGADGTITLQINGIAGNVTYNTIYNDNGVSLGFNFTSNAGGVLVITGLSAGTFDGINVTTPDGCMSNTVGPVTLTDPGAPPIPTITSNTPVCVGQALVLQGNDLMPGGIYTWTFANGSTSTLQNATIANTTVGDIGNYTLSYNIANCISTVTSNIMLYPPIVLTGLTPNTAIAYGSTIQLNVQGALYYWWRPDDGSLNNPNINNPIATPVDSTVYTVIGTSQWGCTDSAHVTITVNGGAPVVIPSAFTPNGDGLNDVFKVGNLGYQKLVDFSVFNRWGQLVYHNSYDPKEGWDGRFNGAPQDMGVYNYVIIVANSDGNNVIYKGDVTLIR